ncbi:polycomb group protein Psc-like [Littorina saxatilis]|uniref:RING-type domain-containing protein n=1 Tax=Littorina saxatilis TaxID=31220 RepID=A0AAN9GI37_9CAEN
MKSTRKRMRVTDLNPNLICVLCGGYFIDATTLTECLHSFCKTCIVNFLKTSKHCPVCDVMVHKTKPHLHIRSDKTLQDLVYKLVPGLYKNEMKRRRDYFTQHPLEAPPKVGEERGDENAERILYTEDEKFSMALHFCSQGVKDERSVRTLSLPEVGVSTAEMPKNVRYLQCPAGVTVDILKKFVRIKYELSEQYQVDIFHTDESLRDEFTLMDVAYIYTWRRKEPLKLYFSVYEFIVKKRKVDCIGTKRLLNLNNLIKHEAKSPADTKSDTKPDTAAPANPSTKSATGDKLGKQGDKLGKQGDKENKEEDVIKEEAGDDNSVDTRVVELMDTSLTTNQQQAVSCEAKQPAMAELMTESDAQAKADVKLEKNASEKTLVKHDKTLSETTAGEKDVKAAAKPPTSFAVAVHATNNSVHTTPAKPSSGTPKAVLFKSNAPGMSEKEKAISSLNRPFIVSKPNPTNPKTVTVSSASVPASSKTAAAVNNLMSNGVQSSPTSGQTLFMANVTNSAVNAKTQTQGTTKEAAKTTAGNAGRKKAVLQQPSAVPSSSSAASSAASTSSPAGVPRPSSLQAASTGQAKAGVSKPRPKVKPVLAAQASSTLLPALSTNTMPSAAAGAAGAASPTPASLAASSSPSPPMASSAACVKDTVEQPLKMSVSSRPTTTAVSTAVTSVTSFKQLSGAAVSLTVPVVSTAMRSFTTNTNSKSVLKQPSLKNNSLSSMDQSTKSVPMLNDNSKASSTLSVVAGGNYTAKDTIDTGVASSSSSGGYQLTVSTSTSVGSGTDSLKLGKDISSPIVAGKNNNSTNGGQRVLTACRAAVMASQATGPLLGRNGMPAVVAKPTRVSNAATSVNTLLHKLPVSSPQHTAVKVSDTATTVSSVSARPSGTASPMCKQPGKTITSPDTLPKQSPAQTTKAPTLQSPKDASKAGVSGAGVVVKQTVRRTGIATTLSVQPSRQGGTTAQTARPNGASVPVSVPSSRPSGASPPVPPQPSRTSGAATPVPIQPQPLVSSGQAMAMAGCSPNVVAAMRRASEMQTFQQVFAQHAKQQQHQQHQQQQQQQLLEFQQLQLLQQQQIFNYHAAAIALARYNQLQQSSGMTSPSHLTAAPAAITSGVSVAATHSPAQLQSATDNAKKQTTPEAPAKKQSQSSTPGGKKGHDPSPKKKITDIANSLHKKVSQQTLGSANNASSAKLDVTAASADKRPPLAHTPTSPTLPKTTSASTAGSKSQAGAKGEDEPLNLVMSRGLACHGAAATAAVKPVAEKSL